jgi:hypothetical protein
MALWRDVWRIINRAQTSTCYADTAIRVRSNDHFKALPLTKQTEINLFIENEQKCAMRREGKALDTLDDARKRSAGLVPLVVNNYQTSKPVTAAVRDAIANMPAMLNVPGQDPATMNVVVPNLYISPQEAAAVYSQKGLPETIINKKGKSPLLNGVKIKNPRLTPKQHDVIREDMVKHDLANKIVAAILQSLIYGGALLFPMFKRDSPATMHLPVEALLRYGIAGKGCIDWMVALDRWNCVHIPNWNPAARDFLYPRHYYIPFLGAHVSGERCARIVTAPQVGYWAVLTTLGWGVSDIPGWIESVYNYYNVMAAIPTMLNQMSILVRTLNVDQILATEGWDILGSVDLETTLKIREASVNNPINMDIIGDLKSVERDFKEVPNLVRLIRQDVGGRANIPEELLWSSERGAFSSGDPTEGAQEKQWESIKYVHRDVAGQLKNVAMLEVINALGKDRDVLSALPYTTIEFDNPVVANAEVRAKIAKDLGDSSLNMTGSGIPPYIVAQIISSFADEEFSVSSDWIEELKRRQKETDDREKETHEKEIALLEAQARLTNEQADNVGVVPAGGAGGTPAKGKILTTGSGGKGYDRLEQKKHEKTRGPNARRESVARRQSKFVGK